MQDRGSLEEFIAKRAGDERARALRNTAIFSLLGMGLALVAVALFNGACLFFLLSLGVLFEMGLPTSSAWIWTAVNGLLAAWIAFDLWRRPLPEAVRATFAGPEQAPHLEFMPRPPSHLVRHPVGLPEKILDVFRGASEIFLSGPHMIQDAVGEYLLYRRLRPEHERQLKEFVRDLVERGGRWAVPSEPRPAALHMAPLAMHLGLVLKVDTPEGTQLRVSRVLG